MPKIKDDIVEKIKASANIVDVVEDAGFQLRRKGAHLECLCPFHADRNLGSFVVNERRNFYYCFSCEAKGDAIKFVMEYHKLSYRDALLYIAAIYNIYVEEDDHYKDMVAKRENYKKTFVPREPLPPLKWMVWPLGYTEPYMHHAEDNVLLTWMRGKLPEQFKSKLDDMIEQYRVGTSLKGYTAGWVIWPQIDMEMRLRDMKFMKYKADGHRDKEWNPNWMSSMLAKAGQMDADTYEARRCLFGLHLAKKYPKAQIALVESEKTALLCSAFCDPNIKIWMAVGGLKFFNAEMLDPLIRDNRDLVAYPDIDGMEKWQRAIDSIGYNLLTMTVNMRPVSEGGQYDPIKDGPKADIADIMIRLMSDIPETEAEKVARMLGAYDKVQDIAYMMDKLNLEIEQ